MTNLQFADGTELPLASTPEQTTASESIEGVSGRTILRDIQITPSDTVTAESVKAIVSDPAKTSTIKIVTDSVVTGTYDNFTILIGGVTLDTALIFTLVQRTTAEVESKNAQKELALTQSALFALQAYVAKNKGV